MTSWSNLYNLKLNKFNFQKHLLHSLYFPVGYRLMKIWNEVALDQPCLLNMYLILITVEHNC